MSLLGKIGSLANSDAFLISTSALFTVGLPVSWHYWSYTHGKGFQLPIPFYRISYLEKMFHKTPFSKWIPNSWVKKLAHPSKNAAIAMASCVVATLYAYPVHTRQGREKIWLSLAAFCFSQLGYTLKAKEQVTTEGGVESRKLNLEVKPAI